MKKPMPLKPGQMKMRMGAPVKKAAAGGMMAGMPRATGQGMLPAMRKPSAGPLVSRPRPTGKGELPAMRKPSAGPLMMAPRPEGQGMLPAGRKFVPQAATLPAFKKKKAATTPKTGGESPAYRKGGKVNAPWDKPRPANLGKSKPMSPAQKSSAKASAKAAGRPYPNLVDNMNASKK